MYACRITPDSGLAPPTISAGRYVVQCPFHGKSALFKPGRVKVSRNPDRIAPTKHAAGERTGQEEPVPRVEDFFFDAPNATGKIGSPVNRAS